MPENHWAMTVLRMVMAHGNIIQDFFTKAANWPLGAALSMVMLLATLALVADRLRRAE